MFPVLLDAGVLVPPTLADTVLRVAEAGVVGPRWSRRILDEVAERMVAAGASASAAARRVGAMTSAFPYAEVAGQEEIEPILTNTPSRRHVLAAAIRSEAHTVVTFDLDDFPAESLEPWGIETVHPDQFMFSQLDLTPGLVLEALGRQSAGYTRPTRPISEILGTLGRSGLPDFADECRRYLPEG
ncbi:PIN domain-containing protein [Ornithinimicrobium sp. W1679]|uniref:PIN domain-containing protein n=1 Tax=Ornithinimicrobium sp. W1679 TaxID=3418770 RepID=UPI003CF68763